MKGAPKKIREREPDDSLFGLLAAYKIYNTYFRILSNEEKKIVILHMTENPKFFPEIGTQERYEGFRVLKGTEMNVQKLSVKYISPVHIIDYYGSAMGLRVTKRVGKIENHFQDEKKYYHIETSISQCSALVQTVKKIITLAPQKKYEIIEKYLSEMSKNDVQE